MRVEHKTEKGTILFLKIENDYSVAGLNDGHIYFWTSSLLQSMGDYPLCVEIPKGDFEYIGFTSEVTEDQAKMILDSEKPSYGTNSEFTEQWASDSFKSLMQHLQVYEVNPFVCKSPNEFHHKQVNQDHYNLWKEAESRTGKWVVLFKPNEKKNESLSSS